MTGGGESHTIQRDLQFQSKSSWHVFSNLCHRLVAKLLSAHVVLNHCRLLAFCEKLHLSGRDLCYLMGKSPLIFFFFNLLQQLFLKLKRPFNALNHHRWQVIIQWIIFYASRNSLHTAQDIEVWPKSVVQLSVTTAFLVYYFSGEQMR